MVQSTRRPWVAPGGLVAGAVLGVLGTFMPSASVRGLLWGVDGVALIVATALLTIYHCRRGNDVIAAGFLVFLAGEALIVAGGTTRLRPAAPWRSWAWSGALADAGGHLVHPLLR